MKRLVTMLLLALCLTAQAFISESSFTPIIYQGSSQSVGLSTSGSNVSGSIGAGKNSSSEDSQWVNNTTTLIGGGKVNITADKTTVTGGIIANATRNNDGSLTDHGNMNLVTDELIINDLQDHNRSDSKGIDLSAGLSKSGTSSVGLQKDGHNTEQITFATLGGGTVTKKSGEQHDLTNTNRDINNTQEITLDQQTAGMNATVTVDHRLLSEGGRNAIKEDFTKTGMIVDTVALIATTDRVGITDFFKETGKKHTTYEGIKSENANNPELANQLQNPDLTPDQKEAMLDQLTHRVMKDLGYDTTDYQNTIVANNKDYVQGADGKTYERHGFYSEETQNAYINDAFIKDTKGLVTTAGHELSHAMDDRSGVSHSEKDNDTYANQFGNNFGSYTNVALGVTGNGSMASTNNHVGNNSQKVYTQTQSYNALDKNKGDDLLFLAAPAVPVITAEAVTAVATLATAVGLKVFGDDIAEAIGVESKPTILETPAITLSAEDSRIDGSQIVEQDATIYTTPEYTDNNNLYVNIPEGTDVNANSGGYQGEPISLDDLVMMANNPEFDRNNITAGFQDHHIISDKNKLTQNHELLELSGFDLQNRQNKIFLPVNETLHPTRSIHNGRHITQVSKDLEKQMDAVVEYGQQQGWTQKEYKQELEAIIAQERKLLKSGERALNKNQRDWSK